MDSQGLIRITPDFFKSKGLSMVDLKKYLTVRQVAKKLDITEEWVRDLIAKKEIKATKVGRWKIKLEDLEKFIDSRTNK